MTANTMICPICEFTEFELISEQVFDAPKASIYECKSCQVVFQYPIMPQETAERFYESDFPSYMQTRAGSGKWETPQDHFGRFVRTEGARRLESLARLLQPDWDILEIGSSTGYLLHLLQSYVRSVIGVEPGADHAAFANKKGIHTVANLEELGGNAQYDAILIYYVLEHIREPVGFLRTLRSSLKPGGMLLIEVPNVLDVLLSRYQISEFGRFYWQKMHYYYFSPDTLSHVLKRAGYRSQLIPLQRYDLSNHVVWLRDGRPGGMSRFQDIFTVELESAYAETLKKQWLCDTILAIAQPMGE